MDTRGIASELLMETLSDDAKVILGTFFGPLGIPGRSKLTYRMKEVRPTHRAQKALDELVHAGAMKSNAIQAGGVEYVVQINCTDFGQWVGRNPKKANWAFNKTIPPSSSGNTPHSNRSTS